MVDIKVKKLTKTATIPTKAHDSDACYDLYLDDPLAEYRQVNYNNYTPVSVTTEKGIKIAPNSTVILNTGIATEIPEGYYCAVYTRSGLGIKRNLRPANCVGIIDSSYRGEWKVALINDGYVEQVVKHGDRIAQFAILPVLESTLTEVEELSETERGEGGFGSSGK